jgi:hypothetical protein
LRDESTRVYEKQQSKSSYSTSTPGPTEHTVTTAVDVIAGLMEGTGNRQVREATANETWEKIQRHMVVNFWDHIKSESKDRVPKITIKFARSLKNIGYNEDVGRSYARGLVC